MTRVTCKLCEAPRASKKFKLEAASFYFPINTKKVYSIHICIVGKRLEITVAFKSR